MESAAEPVAEQAEAIGKQGVLEMTQEEILTIDLLLTKERLATAEEKLAAVNLREAQAKLMDVGKRKAVLLAKMGSRVGGRIKSARVVGQTKLVYELE